MAVASWFVQTAVSIVPCWCAFWMGLLALLLSLGLQSLHFDPDGMGVPQPMQGRLSTIQFKVHALRQTLLGSHNQGRQMLIAECEGCGVTRSVADVQKVHCLAIDGGG